MVDLFISCGANDRPVRPLTQCLMQAQRAVGGSHQAVVRGLIIAIVWSGAIAASLRHTERFSSLCEARASHAKAQTTKPPSQNQPLDFSRRAALSTRKICLFLSLSNHLARCPFYRPNVRPVRPPPIRSPPRCPRPSAGSGPHEAVVRLSNPALFSERHRGLESHRPCWFGCFLADSPRCGTVFV